MKIRTSLVRKNRRDRLWSQEQLAEACGLGLRTIQRLEKEGSASLETVRALCAVFEISSEALLITVAPTEAYRHTQRSDYLLIAFFSTAVLIVALQVESASMPAWSFSAILLGLLVLTVLFASMTVQLEEDSLKWHFGPGFWRRRLEIGEIASARVVKNSLLLGFGVRNYGTGWLYAVSGLHAVEFQLASGASIRLGTDQPNFLLQAFEEARAARE